MNGDKNDCLKTRDKIVFTVQIMETKKTYMDSGIFYQTMWHPKDTQLKSCEAIIYCLPIYL